MPFVKIDTGLLDSSLWMERNQREIFITSLLLATPREFTEPMPQFEVRDLTPTGFVVPPGWYGFVAAAGSGIIRRALVPLEEGMTALEELGREDTESRSQEFGGRRLVRVNGGYIVLNYMTYRERDYTAAERAKRYRMRKAAKQGTCDRNATTRDRHSDTRDRHSDTRDGDGVTRDDVTRTRNVTQAEAEAYLNPPTPLQGGPSVSELAELAEANTIRSKMTPPLPPLTWEDYDPHRNVVPISGAGSPGRKRRNRA